MRDIIITLIVFGSVPYILARPYIGVLMWSWIGYMSPHRLSFGFAYDFPFAALIGLVTLASIPFFKEPKRIPINSITVVLILFLLWVTITTIFSHFPELAFEQWKKVMKIQLMVLLTLMVMGTKKRIEALVWVIVISIGFYGIKGGIFAILTKGQNLVWGPPGSFIEGNNELAFALVTIFALLRYLQLQTQNIWLRRGLAAGMLAIALSILASYSRGAFLGLAFVTFFLLLKSRKKLLLGMVVILCTPLLFIFMPQKWTERVETIQTYEQDESAMGRIYVWQLATKIAQDNFSGGGFGIFASRFFHNKYQVEITGSPDAYIATDAHSIYFLVLGEHGFIGLFIFLLLWFLTFRTGSSIRKLCKNRTDLKWASDLASHLQVCLIGFAVSGAFVGQSYFDLYYHLIAIMALVKALVERELKEQKLPTVSADQSPTNAKPVETYSNQY